MELSANCLRELKLLDKTSYNKSTRSFDNTLPVDYTHNDLERLYLHTTIQATLESVIDAKVCNFVDNIHRNFYVTDGPSDSEEDEASRLPKNVRDKLWFFDTFRDF